MDPGTTLTLLAIIVAVIFGIIQTLASLFQVEGRDLLRAIVDGVKTPLAEAGHHANAAIWAVRRRLGHARTFTVGCFPYEPLSVPSYGKDGQVTFEGPWPALVRSVARRMDIEVKLEPVSATGFQYPKKLKHDLVVGLFETEWRKKYFRFSDGFHRIRLQGVCRKDHPLTTKERLLEEETRIVVQPGEVGWEYVQEQIGSAKLNPRIKEAPLSATHEVRPSGKHETSPNFGL